MVPQHPCRTGPFRLRTFRRRAVLPALLALSVSLTGCSAEARKDAAASLFIKLVNAKCRAAKNEAKLAWDIADALGADDQLAKARSAAAERTNRLVEEINKLAGPVDARRRVTELFASSSEVLADVSDGKITTEEGRKRLEELREKASDEGLGDCVSL